MFDWYPDSTSEVGYSVMDTGDSTLGFGKGQIILNTDNILF